MSAVAEVLPDAKAGPARRVRNSRCVRDRGRSAVLGLVEEAMRSLIDRGFEPTVVAIKTEAGVLSDKSIRRARAELTSAGIVRVPDGLRRMSDGFGVERMSPEELRSRASEVLAERAARARGMCDPDLFPSTPVRRHGFVGDFRRVLRAERGVRAWVASRREGGGGR